MRPFNNKTKHKSITNLKMSEATLQTKIIRFLKLNNFYLFKVIRSSRSGTPDIIACKHGLFIGIEVKSEKGVMSALQKVHRLEIKQTKGLHYTVKPSNFESFKVDILKN